MKGDGTNVMSSEHSSRWRPGVMVLVAVTVLLVVVVPASCATNRTDSVGSTAGYGVVYAITTLVGVMTGTPVATVIVGSAGGIDVGVTGHLRQAVSETERDPTDSRGPRR